MKRHGRMTFSSGCRGRRINWAGMHTLVERWKMKGD
jgi:hypothetical protein